MGLHFKPLPYHKTGSSYSNHLKSIETTGMYNKKWICLAAMAFSLNADAQQIRSFSQEKDGWRIASATLDNNVTVPLQRPLFSVVINGKQYRSDDQASFNGMVSLEQHINATGNRGMKGTITLRNVSRDTLTVENLVPLGEGKEIVYITGKGKHGLSRTHLFQPGKNPVNVIVPDNAWELGFSAVSGNGYTIAALVRRDKDKIEKGSRRRFETVLYPGGSVQYRFYAEGTEGDWHTGLKRIFQDRMLYDVEDFNNELFERADLKWVRHSYVQHLMMNWDKFYYDYETGKFNLKEFLERGKQLYGGDDIVSIWPTWPTLGLDQRNQFDLFRDLPGGTAKVRELSAMANKMGTRMFICYNPWDGSTRSEDHFEGLSDLIKETASDGVVLDTKGESSRELQDAADRVRPGVIMYSEGMAVPKDMSGIVSGRVHNALYYAPMLNLNKLIKPEFTIYRVAELFKEPIQREFATSFFNGYGTEMNIMAPGQPDRAEEQYKYLGRTSMILRENTHNFVSRGYTPLVPVLAENIWANKWELPEKTIYTIYSLIPEGYNDTLMEMPVQPGFHVVDLWNHSGEVAKANGNTWRVYVSTNAFHKKDLGTNNEAEVGCVAVLPQLIKASLNGDDLAVETIAGKGDELRIWAGHPSYQHTPEKLRPGKHQLRVHELFGRFEGKLVVQLMDKGILLDEAVLHITPGAARRISAVAPTRKHTSTPEGMVNIPAGNFHFKATNGDEFIPYPKQDQDSIFKMSAFYMDKFPVTNIQFYEFLKSTGYRPTDTANFLRHWVNGNIPKGEEQFPVVYVSYEDAKAYATWAGKRLPTEVEWQYAAQTSAGNEWPWKQVKPVTRKQETITATLTVSSLEGIDPRHCNLGNGKPYKVGSYPKGANPFGLQDLVGCVWQMTNDLYMNGSYRYIMMKGGSYFKPSSSWWYVQGGPRELHYRQFLLRVSQGFERNATVGFRCVADR